jgi:hypothetical protein
MEPMTDAETRRERKEVWTWRFGAALTSATRITYVIECHFADMYDEIRFYLNYPEGTEHRPFVAFNREGRLHVRGAFEPGSLESLDVRADSKNAVSVNEAVEWVLRNLQSLGGPPIPQLARSLHTMADLLSEAIESSAGGPWEWRNGYLDTASRAERRESYFQAIPAAAVACRPEAGDLRGIPEYRLWFLVGSDDIPRLAIESNTGATFVGY